MQSVHKAWMDISRKTRSGLSRYRQLCNPFHPVALAYERHIVRGRRYKKLIALTQRVKDDLIRFYDVPEHDVVIVPNGFNPREFNPSEVEGGQSREEVRRSFGMRDASATVILFVANEVERKGLRQLLRAVGRSKRYDTHVVAVGRFNPADCAGEVVELGLTGRVTFLPSSSDLKPLYMAADVFALPTQYEAWGLVLVEALACGLPVLTTRLAGAAVAVREGSSGHLVEDPFDVEEILDKLDRTIQLCSASRPAISASVDQYRWDRVLPAYERVLIECSG
jgi:UDP-glucose:(heptosyl)LPS alpha-1,3-glucosyltransferase